MCKFRISIGDWSEGGHGKREDFIVDSNVPVEVVREAHYAMKDMLGINIENICSRYDESVINAEITRSIRELGFEFEYVDNGEVDTYPEEMARLWLFLLQKVNPNMELHIINDEIPTLHFCGFDSQKRHIKNVGYGLLS